MSQVPGDTGARVLVLGFPLPLSAEASEHHASLTREFQLIALASSDETEPHRAVPARLLRLVDHLTGEYQGLTHAQDAERERAHAEGRASVDLTFDVPARVAGAALALDRMLDEADEFCRRGELLTLATPPHLVAFRRWYLAEFIGQIGGAAPTSWPDFLAAQPERVRAAVEGASTR